jgi:hypothetical protein
MSTPIDIKGGNNDNRLAVLLQMIHKATKTFVHALPDMTDHIAFRAFTIKAFEGEEADLKWRAFEDVIFAGVMQSLEGYRKEIEHIRIDLATKKEDDDMVIWMLARHRTPEDDKPEEEAKGGALGSDKDTIEIVA